ncbi:MAG TPA: antibiotic biosynthesis monooxygenase [Candidatus Limnocylindrales bacterium]|jgi:hypothetical protein|nr:antibiotic biosynthesis monooxygenase [Candidatus Limnocylindrales bacterium]
MRYTRLATYDVTDGTFPELTNIIARGLLPLFEQEPGFVNYGLVDTGHKKVVSISIWESHEEAEKSVMTAATWLEQNLANRVHLVNSQVGHMALFNGKPAVA